MGSGFGVAAGAGVAVAAGAPVAAGADVAAGAEESHPAIKEAKNTIDRVNDNIFAVLFIIYLPHNVRLISVLAYAYIFVSSVTPFFTPFLRFIMRW